MISYHTSPLASLGAKQSGGMNVVVRQLSEALCEKGHKVDIFTRSKEGDDLFKVRGLGANCQVISLHAGPQEDIAHIDLPSYIDDFTSQSLAWVGETKNSYDVIYAHYWMSGLAAIGLKKEWGVPVVLMMHTLGLMKERIAALNPSEADARIRGERRALAAADKIVAATIAEKAELQWLYEIAGHKVEVISPGVDLALFSPLDKGEAREKLKIEAGAKILLFVGRIEMLKGIDTLIKALKILNGPEAKGGEKAFLHIIGGQAANLAQDSEEMKRLRDLVAKLGLEKQVIFLGSRRQEELPLHYAAADIVVLPSHYESFGLVALEAMACARPVVASRVGGLLHLIRDGENGYQVPQGDTRALAEKIGELLFDEGQLQAMGDRARSFAENYPWEGMAGKIEDLFGKLIG